MGERQFGPYRLVRQIAVGGMAEIHLAKTKGIAGFEKYVALKMIHPNFAEDEQFIQMLVDEAKIAVQLNHGNIAQTFDLGRVGDTYYITMEYVDGADLYKILRRGSEQDVEMPLDVCAFIAKEIASALDHAHRKRDHLGKMLGIVHRDVSPQNVLISFSGEVKLVDFGIAKATMKARQTAVGVIKGKYYYMSPEQAWGDPIDLRSDIFSAGIVLYEMLTGQMLYLEEDLHRLLDMARRAEIALPSTLRKGIPPQLERILMRALAKSPDDRYQTAGDLASDLERFLHAYSPVFTAAKLAMMLKRIVGDPANAPEADHQVEVRDGPIATYTLQPEDLIHDKKELHDENSVIFRVAELQPRQPEQQPPSARAPTVGSPAGRVTRQADINDILPPPVPAVRTVPTPPAAQPQVRVQTKSRLPHEETREVEAAPPGANDESGLLTQDGGRIEQNWETETQPTQDRLDNIGERTLITAPPIAAGFMMDVAGEDGVEATIVTGAPVRPDSELDDDGETGVRPSPDEEDGPTVQRDFRDPSLASRRGPAPPALAAKIHAPAVSELRKPRASRKTPGAGVPQPNVLQAIVGSQPNEPMPAPMPARRSEDSSAASLPEPPTTPAQPFNGHPYDNDASGLPHGTPVVQYPPPGYPPPGYPPPGYPPAGYPPPPYSQPYPPYPQPYPQMSPGSLYPFQPTGAPPPTPMSLTGQLRLFEADELPAHMRMGDGGRGIKLAIAAVLAISVAAGVTFFIVRAARDTAPTVGTIKVASEPPNAEVYYDGQRLAGTTPFPIESVPVGTRHEVRVELGRHKSYTETVDMPKQGGEVQVTALLKPITGKLRVATHPDGADIVLDGQLRGRTSTTVNDIDMTSAKHLELRLKDYQPFQQDLVWPANGEIELDVKLQR